MEHKELCSKHYGFFINYNKVLQTDKSEFQEIKLVETDMFGKVLILDNIVQIFEKKDWQYHEIMVNYPLLALDECNDINVLVIGGGDGGIVKGILNYNNIKNIDFVELDKKVVDFSLKHLKSINSGAFENDKVKLYYEDGRKFIENKKANYDVVIMDMTDPFGPSKYLYTQEFFTLVKNSLKEKGNFIMHSESPDNRPEAYSCILKTLQSTFKYVDSIYNYVQMYGGLWSYALSSNYKSIKELKSEDIEYRIKNRLIKNDFKLIDKDTWKSMQVEFKYIKEKRNIGRIITDKNPNFNDLVLD